jgi:hypothetical protein
VFDLFVSDKLPEKVMSEVILGWMRDFSENHGLYEAMGVRNLVIRPVMFGFILEAREGESATIAPKEVKDAVLEPVT